ncbi:MAG: alpha/beta hydrolase [Polyangiaceae bacterium]|nr:alpha/beta hydrolase [Polyangiaceae bacterium]MCW5792151.1 alpha/beta hydrolase [Polyangiaceae bacterium]
MILDASVVEQAIDVGAPKAWFVKQLIMTREGSTPLSMVRKRAAVSAPTGAATEALAKPCRAALLLIHGYGQNRYAWHLPSRSMANHLAAAGYDVFNVDLRGHGRSERLGARLPERVEQFVQEDLPAAMASVHRLSGHSKIYLVGHSLGGLCAYGVAASRPEQVAGVVSIGSPYHFTRGTRVLAGLADAFLALDRRLGVPDIAIPARWYGRFVGHGQRMVNSRLYPVPLRGFLRGSMEREVLREHMALAMDQGSVVTMRALFAWGAESRASSTTPLFGLTERFEGLDLPLLIIAGTSDDLAPPPSVKPAYERSRAQDRSYRELPFGHIDLLVGRDAPRFVWPLVERWIARRLSAPEPIAQSA